MNHEGAKEHEAAREDAEGASRESLCDSLWITTVRTLSKRASSGPAGCDPATSSPGEAFSLVFSRWSLVVSWGEGHEDLLDGGGQVPCIWSKTPR